jgi:hypothetical protein
LNARVHVIEDNPWWLTLSNDIGLKGNF